MRTLRLISIFVSHLKLSFRYFCITILPGMYKFIVMMMIIIISVHRDSFLSSRVAAKLLFTDVLHYEAHENRNMNIRL